LTIFSELTADTYAIDTCRRSPSRGFHTIIFILGSI